MYNQQIPPTIQNMFGKIAKNYDRANYVISCGLFRLWNNRLLDTLGRQNPHHLLDLCAGTGDIALNALKQGVAKKATLVDFCQEMLQIAKGKAHKMGIDPGKLTYYHRDVQWLPLDDASFDAASIAYGIRNVKDPLQALLEVHRVLKEGAQLAILELTRPQNPFLAFAHLLYLKCGMPILGKCVTTERKAYSYLCRSIKDFLSPIQVVALLHEAGFKHAAYEPVMGGIATLFTAMR